MSWFQLVVQLLETIALKHQLSFQGWLRRVHQLQLVEAHEDLQDALLFQFQ
jgi:hypothetical protein